MNFQDLKKIETPDFYLDVAFRKAKQRADIIRSKKNKHLKRIDFLKNIELERISVVKQILIDNFDKMVRAFPSIDNLTEFYKELIRATLDYAALKKSLGAVNSARLVIGDIYKIYNQRIKKTQDEKKLLACKKEFFGRISSIPKRIKRELAYLENARRTMRRYPSIKSNMTTVAIAGFPNAGKSTLLKKLTSSNPDINSYPFTTKGLNVGYMEQKYDKIQFIDTPGTLNRPEKMNYIEKAAFLAMKYVADVIIYVFDPTEEYPIKDQVKLLKRIQCLDKEIVLYLSKADIADKEKIDEIKKLYPKIVTEPKEISSINFSRQ